MNTRIRSTVRRAALAAVAVTAAVALAACGSGESGSPSDSRAGVSEGQEDKKEHNAADVEFAQQMIPHHRQAVEMAELAFDRAASQEVKELAQEIKDAQDPEIETLSEWLSAWGEEVPTGTDGGHGGHGGHGQMPGMMDAGDMAALMESSGEEFDTAFLTMMIEHHEGAVVMAEAQLKGGAHGPAKELAEEVIAAQTAEIERMRELLGES
ncbi:DUF305 domain-containing protein [Streptomyces sodiiphilus]|uniref:DUF305 domain-containing protein n=1 Tax=Streptomyces sodiiphilus TaxID=226217 RepID=A0ABN2PV31_9ACTN